MVGRGAGGRDGGKAGGRVADEEARTCFFPFLSLLPSGESTRFESSAFDGFNIFWIINILLSLLFFFFFFGLFFSMASL